MPAPKSPNTETARAALAAKRQAARLERAATELRDAGWLVMPREQADQVLSSDDLEYIGRVVKAYR
jgi:hypothetical protein